MRVAVLLSAALSAIGCGTMNGARPLEQGKHAVGLTFGGPLLTSLGPAIPLPNLVIEGKSGLDPIKGRATDLNYGLNATAAAFGIVDVHAGASHLLKAQGASSPAISITERLHLASNHLDTTKPSETRAFYAMNQIDFTVSREFSRQLVYGGGALYWNFVNTPSPAYFVGTQLRPMKGRFSIQLEARHMAVGFVPEIQDVSWYSPGSGVLSVTAGIGFDFGGSK